MMASVERRRDTGFLLCAGNGRKIAAAWTGVAQPSLTWAIVRSRRWGRASDLVAPAMFDFSIRRGEGRIMRDEGFIHRPANARLAAAYVRCQAHHFALDRTRWPVWRGRDNSSLVCSNITPYNLPYRNREPVRTVHIAKRLRARPPQANSTKPKAGNANEYRTITCVQNRDPAQVSRRRRHYRRGRGRHAAGVTRADCDLEIPIDLADQGHFPRVRRRLRQEGQ